MTSSKTLPYIIKKLRLNSVSNHWQVRADFARERQWSYEQYLAEDRLWVDNSENIIFIGPSGVGKTHLACGIGFSLIVQFR